MVARFRSQKRYWLSALLIGAVVCSALAAYAPHPAHVEVATALRADGEIMALDYEF